MRASEPFVERTHSSTGINFEDAVVGACNEEISLRTERQMIRRDAHFERGKNEDLLIARDLEDGAVAVTDVQTLFAVEGDASGDSHAFGVRRHGAVLRDTIDGTVEARRDVHQPLAVEGNGRWVHHLRYERLHVVVGIDLKDRDRDFLPSRSGERGIDVAFGIDRRIGNGMEILGDRDCDLHRLRVADVSVGCDNDWTGSRAFGNACYNECVGADDDRSFVVSEFNFGAPQLRWAQAGAGDAQFAPGQCRGRSHRFNVGSAVCIFLAEDTIGESHG